MISSFAIDANQRWTFQLVLLGGRTQLEGWCERAGQQQMPLRCSTWLEPQEDPQTVAHTLMEHPRCALDPRRSVGSRT